MTDTQRELFGSDKWGRPIEPADPNTHADDKPRLSTQNGQVLAMLRRGPVTSIELLNFGITRAAARIHDLRKRGFVIEATRIKGGTEYKLNGQD